MKRLQAVFSLISPCGIFADIGTDHGQIAQYAAGLADRVIATDISEMCLQKARQNVRAANVEFAVGDGLAALDCAPDTIAICGMGGRTIVDILRFYNGSATLILQPQTDVEYVRRFICGAGYVITDDITAFEGKKYYDVLRAVRQDIAAKNAIEKPDDLGFAFGVFYKTKNELLRQRLQEMQKKYERYKCCAKNQELLRKIEQALRWQE